MIVARFNRSFRPVQVPIVRHHVAVIVIFTLICAGCASVPTDYPREPSTAFDGHQDTSVGQLFEELALQHPGKSGFQIMRVGRIALTARLAMVDLAEKSLDVQYYIWERDTSGRLLAERLVRAAGRGVRVRVLVDDINIKRPDSALAAFDYHPNIEVRSFNPFAHRSAKMLGFLVDFGRVNHRMHNKVIVTDNALAIVGGRNIGDHYFGISEDANFRDLDIMAAGPIVRDISHTFDAFWNSEWAIPAAAFVDEPSTEENFRAGVLALREYLAAAEYPYPINQDIEEHRVYLKLYSENFIWAPGEVLFDDPSLVGEDTESTDIRDALYQRIAEVEEELLIEAAYFITGEPSLDTTRILQGKGVKVRVLTNSLASNDVVAAHAGYAKYRQGLIENGVQMYELRANSGSVTRSWSEVAGGAEAGLHTKALVFDRKTAFIGSYNLDPRSAKIDTELGLMIDSAELALRVADYMDEGVRPENSYSVILDEDGRLVWLTEDDGEEVRYYKEPESTFGRRFQAGFIKILPVESQL